MPEVNIYIKTYFKGNLSKGTGNYGIVLEYIKADGTPATIELFNGFSPTTKNRTALIACNEALSRMTKKCFINIHINSSYVIEPINQGWIKNWDRDTWTNNGKPIANSDLWQQLFDYMDKQYITFYFSESNQYSAYIETMLKRLDEQGNTERTNQ